MSKPYLESEEINRAKMCLAGIEDNLQAVKSEILYRDKPYKYYLDEKLQKIENDIRCLLELCDED